MDILHESRPIEPAARRICNAQERIDSKRTRSAVNRSSTRSQEKHTIEHSNQPNYGSSSPIPYPTSNLIVAAEGSSNPHGSIMEVTTSLHCSNNDREAVPIEFSTGIPLGSFLIPSLQQNNLQNKFQIIDLSKFGFSSPRQQQQSRCHGRIRVPCGWNTPSIESVLWNKTITHRQRTTATRTTTTTTKQRNHVHDQHEIIGNRCAGTGLTASILPWSFRIECIHSIPFRFCSGMWAFMGRMCAEILARKFAKRCRGILWQFVYKKTCKCCRNALKHSN